MAGELLLYLASCIGGPHETNQPDSSDTSTPIDTQETDSDTDTDTDSDIDTDSDADADTDTDTDADCDAYSGVRFSETPNSTYTGEDIGDEAGESVALGDINGDGSTDIAVGSSHEVNEYYREGTIYVFEGPTTGDRSLSRAAIKINGQADWRVSNPNIIDLNDDGLPELLFNANNLDGDTGGLIVMAGRSVWDSEYDFYSIDYVHTAGITAVTGVGELTLLGDVNNDGMQEAVSGGGASCEIRSLDPDLLTAGGVMQWADLPVVTEIRDESDNDSNVCDHIVAGNFNGDGDGLKDLLMGNSRTGTTGLGKTWLVENNGDLPLEITIEGDVFSSSWISGVEYLVFNGSVWGTQSGYVVASGAGNADACDDFIIGAPTETNGHSESGGAYSFDGCALRDKALPSGSAIELSEAGLSALGPDIGRVMYGAEDNDEVPVSIAFSQDSACPDLSLLAISSATGYGAVYPVSRSTWETLPTMSTVDDADQEIEGEDYLAEFGRTILMSDVDGDGTADLIVAAPSANDDEGKVEVHLGSKY